MKQYDFDFESQTYIPLAPVDEAIERSKIRQEIAPYVPPRMEVEPRTETRSVINYKEATKVVAFVGVTASIVYVGYIAVVAFASWVAANIALIGGGAIGCFVLWAFASNKEAGPKEYGSKSTGGASGGANHYHYYQNNSFGGNAEQNNS